MTLLAVDRIELHHGRPRTIWSSLAWLTLPADYPRNWPRPRRLLNDPTRQLELF